MSKIKQRVLELKANSGTHSPSIDTLIESIPEIKIDIDACFLSNPYATDFFLEELNKDIVLTGKLRKILEFYPPQNREVSKILSKAIGVNYENIFIGNGAIEIIQAVIQRFCKKIVIILPTFSSYYEYVRDDQEVVFYNLVKEKNFEFNVDDYIQFVRHHNPDTIVLINPNNPNGGFIDRATVSKIFFELDFLENIIIDESFVHFSFDGFNGKYDNWEGLAAENSKIIVIKSMSKDFGIAGIRAGYGIMSADRVSNLLKNGYLWNVSGLAVYFFKKYSSEEFRLKYDMLRRKYILYTNHFIAKMRELEPNIKVYPSKANFVLVELTNGMTSTEFTFDLIEKEHIYVRDCADKIGLDGEFIRIAARTFEENEIIFDSMKKLLS